MSQYGNYKSPEFEKMRKDIDAICTNLILKSWWASWMPFDWTQNLAARYYAKKALRIYMKQFEKK